jgi:hypothetical protein
MTVALFAATTHGGAVPSPLTVVVAIVAVTYILWSRTQGRLFNLRRMVLLPAVLIVIGITGLTGSAAVHFGPKDVAFLVASVGISAVLGAVRGGTIELFSRQGALWQRYTRWTVLLWIALIVTRLVMIGVASSAGASAGGGTNSLLLTLGISLLAEAGVVGTRALSATASSATVLAAPDRDRFVPVATAAPRADGGDAVRPVPRPTAIMSTDSSPQPRFRHDGRARRHSGPAHRLIGQLLETRTQ